MAVQLDGTKAEVLNEDPLVIKNLKNWYHSHTYGGWSRFFKGLQEGKLLGTRCTNRACREHRIFLPPRTDCVDCWRRTEWVEAPPKGRIYTFSEITYPGELFRAQAPVHLISVEIDGACTKLMSYLWEGKPSFGMPVVAKFHTEHPTNTILDLCWVPA
ncbi:MAG: OB-fold domain-containing protein [Pseudomonadales bacterium]|jgi:uncharacterized OB-fold protein|nr:OB-fold domain-containing protein [Pseudomonadales bacterium]